MPARLQISEHQQPGDAAEIFLRACSDHPVRAPATVTILPR